MQLKRDKVYFLSLSLSHSVIPPSLPFPMLYLAARVAVKYANQIILLHHIWNQTEPLYHP